MLLLRFMHNGRQVSDRAEGAGEGRVHLIKTQKEFQMMWLKAPSWTLSAWWWWWKWNDAAKVSRVKSTQAMMNFLFWLRAPREWGLFTFSFHFFNLRALAFFFSAVQTKWNSKQTREQSADECDTLNCFKDETQFSLFSNCRRRRVFHSAETRPLCERATLDVHIENNSNALSDSIKL